MPTLIPAPTRIVGAGQGQKSIAEYIGRLNSGHAQLSVAHMIAPGQWHEPGQRPDFDEYTLVLKGTLIVEHDDGRQEVAAGQAIIAHAGQWVRYSTGPEGAEYVAICLPAFSPDTVHRDE